MKGIGVDKNTTDSVCFTVQGSPGLRWSPECFELEMRISYKFTESFKEEISRN